MKIDAAILIGDQENIHPIQGGNKNFLRFTSIAYIFYSLKAFGRITICQIGSSLWVIRIEYKRALRAICAR